MQKTQTTNAEDSNELQLLSYESLGGSTGVCGGSLAHIGVPTEDLGAVREALAADKNVSLYVDPVSAWDTGQSRWATSRTVAFDYATTVGLSEARARGLTGIGTTIAIIDTGLTNQPGMAAEYRWNVTGGASRKDAGAHGTPVGMLANHRDSGIAPRASLVSVRACESDNSCRLDNVIKGICTVINEPRIDKAKLVLNLSLGGRYKSNIIERILQEVTAQGTLVALAAGNEGEDESPLHFPAAYAKDIEGAIAIGALAPAQVTNTFWVYIDDALANPWDTTTSEAMTWSIKETRVEAGTTYHLIGNTNGGAPLHDTPVTQARSVLCVSQGKPMDSPSFVTPERSPGGSVTHSWSGREALLTPPVIGSKLSSLELANELCEAEANRYGLSNFEMAEFHNQDSTRVVAWKYWIPAAPTTAVDPAAFSTRGSYVELSAPGDSLNVEGYVGLSGTSFATPIVSGAMALWRQQYPEWTPAEIEQAMKNAAKILPGKDLNAVGVGMIDLSVSP